MKESELSWKEKTTTQHWFWFSHFQIACKYVKYFMTDPF